LSKEMYIQAHEELMNEYQEEHPNASWDEAYEKCGDDAHERMIDNYADLADREKDRRKEEG